MNHMNSALQLLLVLGLFILDISGIMLLNTQIIQLVLCFYILRLFDKPALVPLVSAALCICLESLILYDSLTIPFIYLVPTTVLIIYLKKTLVPHPLYRPLALALCLIIQQYLLHPGALGDTYTIAAFIVNIVIILSCSLIW